MAKPIGIQLYSLREYSEKDFLSVLKGVAEIGYTYVEPAGIFDFHPTEFLKILIKIIDCICTQVPRNQSVQ